MIPVAKPALIGNEKRYVNQAIKDGWISSRGSFIDLFEKNFSEYTKSKYAISVSNGTTALVTALKSLGIGNGDEVLLPSLTFGATANSVISVGAKPIFVDSSDHNWNMNIDDIENKISKKTKCIIIVHLYGLPCEIKNIIKICKKYNIFLIEDCAEALGAKYFNKHVGSFGDVGTFSFFGNKNISTGEGGMCITKSSKIAKKIRILRDHGMDPNKRYWHLEAGYNHRMTNLQAAIGCAQLENIEKLIMRRNEIQDRYHKFFSKKRYYDFIRTPQEATPVNWLFCFLLSKDFISDKKKLLKYLMDNGIETRSFFYPLHTMKTYQFDHSQLVNAEFFFEKGFNLPTYYELKDREIDYICFTVDEYFQKK